MGAARLFPIGLSVVACPRVLFPSTATRSTCRGQIDVDLAEPQGLDIGSVTFAVPPMIHLTLPAMPYTTTTTSASDYDITFLAFGTASDHDCPGGATPAKSSLSRLVK